MSDYCHKGTEQKDKYQLLVSVVLALSSVLRLYMRGEPKSDIDLYVINKVKQLRTDRKISQAVLAIKLTVSDAFIGQVESPKSRKKYNLDQLNKLAQIFECSPKDFLPEKAV